MGLDPLDVTEEAGAVSDDILVAGAGNDDDDNYDNDEDTAAYFHWTVGLVCQAIGLMILAGFCEIGGGWMVWKAVRDSSKPWWWVVPGSVLLIVYGFIPTLQPTDSFGRIYAAYGVFFIFLSFLAGWVLDGDRPDLGDVIGGPIALVGGLIILFWPR